jgi:DNA-binding response OmpR family regulator
MANDNKKKIYLIDDDDMHLTTAELFLKDEYEIYKAKSGKEALEYMSGNKFVPNVILLDIIMPDMDGWNVLKKIKEMDFLKNVPIAFLTSVEDEIEKKRAYKIGIADYITKPFNMMVLKSRIKELLKKHESR